MLLIVLYDSVILVQMNWYTGDSVTPIRDDIAISIVRRVQRIMYCPNDTKDKNTTTPSSSLSPAATVTVAYPWVHGISTVPNRVRHDNKQ